ncbi:MAG: A/G-specific adenine glycosylase [Candidatus Omnitrophica bacterium]|nr:A/G-specific adenine glycosylase [Candidatus Omnitrophota bacterium]
MAGTIREPPLTVVAIRTLEKIARPLYDTAMRKRNIQRMRSKLLGWFKTHARDLPWRRTKDPYKIWVSEIMLQQTQVETVIPYYRKWIKRFPTIRSLAQASLSEVMKHWAGLGYYRRARMFHQAAKLVSRQCHGKIPRSAETLRKLPGIGRYSAGAIASIAFGQPEPVLDGNVKRILSRIFALKEPADSPLGEKKLWEISRILVAMVVDGAPRSHDCDRQFYHPGDLNQAMMELGATVCLLENPRCETCPVSRLCVAHRMKRENDFPRKKSRERSKRIRNYALILRRNGKVLIQKQPRDARWGGLWMFPYWQDKNSMMRDVTNCFSVGAVREPPLPLQHKLSIDHGFTKYRIKLHVYEFNDASAPHPLPHSRWVPIHHLTRYAFPSPHQKIVSHLLENVR